jgi:putative glutamine amidotransferase
MTALVAITTLNRTIRTLGVEMPSATVHQRLGEFVAQAGGVPVFADHHADPAVLVDHLAAVVINGGGDVAPERYGAERHARTDAPEPHRDEFEIELVRLAVASGIPVLGICRGIQLVNVALGGTLVQHVPDVVGESHLLGDAWDAEAHAVELVAGSMLAALYGTERLTVNSLHHQAVDRPAPGLRVSARAPDGTIEAIEHPDAPVVGVQWHPELLARPAGDEHAVLFEWLLAARQRLQRA